MARSAAAKSEERGEDEGLVDGRRAEAGRFHAQRPAEVLDDERA
jgi:hypothetical protein